MNFPRSAGVLLHPTALPGVWGMGEIGPQARRFLHRLRDAAQTYWQVLPLGPTGYGDSPYQSLSTFAGNPMLISFDDLLEDGLLTEADLKLFPSFPPDRVDYGPVLEKRGEVLDLVCRAFDARADKDLKNQFAAYCSEQAEWLEDFSLFVALKESHKLRPWPEWETELVQREPHALEAARRQHAQAIQAVKIKQFLFARQWEVLRETARSAGVKLIGDIPIFVSHDSADVWANQDLFSLDAAGHPTVVAGVPPDYFSATGQLWGNPLYRWDVHAGEDYSWWMRRMRHMVALVDIVRIDHFRGFEAYWEIPGGDETAENGKWVKGPGADFFQVLQRTLGEIPVIAEDLGVITEEVDLLRDAFDLPGMRILQFSFGEDLPPHLQPETFPENCVVYTGTHDNDTTRGWFWRAPGVDNTDTEEGIQEERQRVLELVNTDGSQIHWDLIALAHRLPPHTAMIPLQDIMGLGSEARMNVPGKSQGNWSWRFREDALRDEDLKRLADITRHFGRGRD